MRSDKRPPVLYLRSFQQESEHFVVGKMEKLRPYFSNWLIKLTAKNHTVVGLTFEEFLGQEVDKELGPFVALGSPKDYLPPEGASRLYASDKNWLKHFDDLLDRCLLVLVEVGESSNLKWELSQIKQRGFKNKLFILTSPNDKRRLNWIAAFFESLKCLFIPPLKSEWSSFASGLNNLGYNLPADHPGLGCVFGFDAKGRAVILTSHAKNPEDFISVIRELVVRKT